MLHGSEMKSTISVVSATYLRITYRIKPLKTLNFLENYGHLARVVFEKQEKLPEKLYCLPHPSDSKEFSCNVLVMYRSCNGY